MIIVCGKTITWSLRPGSLPSSMPTTFLTLETSHRSLNVGCDPVSRVDRFKAALSGHGEKVLESLSQGAGNELTPFLIDPSKQIDLVPGIGQIQGKLSLIPLF